MKAILSDNTISLVGLTREQYEVIRILVYQAQRYSGQYEREQSFGQGDDYLDITVVGCIPLSEQEVDALHTIDI